MVNHTKRKLRNTKRKLRNTKRKLRKIRYKGGIVANNDLRVQYKNMLNEAFNVLDSVSYGLTTTTKKFEGVLSGKWLASKLDTFIKDTIKIKIDEDSADALKKKLNLLADKLTEVSEHITTQSYKDKALQAAEKIRTDLQAAEKISTELQPVNRPAIPTSNTTV